MERQSYEERKCSLGFSNSVLIFLTSRPLAGYCQGKTKTNKKPPKQSWFIPHNFKYMIYLIKKLSVAVFLLLLVELFRTRLANYSQQRKSRPPTIIFAAHELKIVFHIFKWLYKYLQSTIDFAFWAVNTKLFIIWLLAKKKSLLTPDLRDQYRKICNKN